MEIKDPPYYWALNMVTSEAQQAKPTDLPRQWEEDPPGGIVWPRA